MRGVIREARAVDVDVLSQGANRVLLSSDANQLFVG